MAEYNITPYGQTATMPEGYPIYDGLDSNSAQQALSAKQGKRLKEMIDAKADGDLAITRFAVNLCDSSKMTSGTLGSSGDIASGSGIVTDFIPIIVGAGTNNWEQTQFIQSSTPLNIQMHHYHYKPLGKGYHKIHTALVLRCLQTLETNIVGRCAS